MSTPRLGLVELDEAQSIERGLRRLIARASFLDRRINSCQSIDFVCGLRIASEAAAVVVDQIAASLDPPVHIDRGGDR